MQLKTTELTYEPDWYYIVILTPPPIQCFSYCYKLVHCRFDDTGACLNLINAALTCIQTVQLYQQMIHLI